jgi:endonuclease YncB( thermonuclease family)
MRLAQTSKSNFVPAIGAICALCASTLGPGPLLLASPARAAACAIDPKPAGAVVSVTDGRTFVLADGRTVQLGMIEVPPLPEASKPVTEAGVAAARATRAALAALIAGNDILLSPLGDDRYGRLRARGYLADNAMPRGIEVSLVAAGHAFVSPFAGNQNCAADLLAAERKARAGKLGLWGDPYYAARNADDPAEVLAARGRFAIVEGKVVSVRESGGTIYVNFGRRWSEDFTVTISKRNGRQFVGPGLEPKLLTGRRVRVRGVIEERGGPWIEAVAPGQIEIADR